MRKLFLILCCTFGLMSSSVFAQDADPLDSLDPDTDFDLEEVDGEEASSLDSLDPSMGFDLQQIVAEETPPTDTMSATIQMGWLSYKSPDNKDDGRFQLSLGWLEDINGRTAYGVRGTLGFDDNSIPALLAGAYLGLGARGKILVMPALDIGVIFEGIDPQFLMQIGVNTIVYPDLFTLSGGFWDTFAVSVEFSYSAMPLAAAMSDSTYHNARGDPMIAWRWMVGIVLPSFLPAL